MVNKMWDDFPEIRNDIIRCKDYILDFIDIPNKVVREEVIKLINSDAKLIRPALMIIIGKILNGGKRLDDDFIAMASTLEMLHMATLIHDDIIDDSPMRRGVKTIQYGLGKDVATYAGDYMLSSVFSNVVKYSKTNENARVITDSVNKILGGELIQMENRNNFSITEEDYFKIIDGKTAVMIALCCYEGAYMSGNESECKDAWTFGESVGMAFQIIDDILDFTVRKVVTKPPFQDFREGNFTLPTIFSIKTKRKELIEIKKQLIDIEVDKNRYQEELKLSKNDIEKEIIIKKINSCTEHINDINIKLKDIVEKSGGIKYSKNVANEYSEKAISILRKYENCIYKDYLEKLVLKLLNRRF